MRVALVSDVHGNLQALDAALLHASGESTEAVWCMGDMVGYGGQPNEVIDRLREVDARCIIGNHDAAAIDLIGTELFNRAAAESADWTKDALLPESRNFLASKAEVEVAGDWSFVHGTFGDPLWEYLMAASNANSHFDAAKSRLSLVGHTHLPLVVWRDSEGRIGGRQPTDGEVVELNTWDEHQICVNPGGVGQPRDGDPKAPYAILDTATNEVRFHRVSYDIAEAQRHIREAGLPGVLADRLGEGR